MVDGTAKPSPGSAEAIWQGCICPILDNHRGHGIPQKKGPPLFIYTEGCPVHGISVDKQGADDDLAK
jgi:hypothetical protein